MTILGKFLCYTKAKEDNSKEVNSMTLTVYLGIDVGSVTTKLALVDENG